MIKSVKYRLYPTIDQQEKLEKFFGCARFVFNAALITRIEVYQANKTIVSRFDLNNQLKELKDTEGFEWLKEAPAQSLQWAIRNLDDAYKGFFSGKGFPKFKGKHGRQSCSFPQECKIKQGEIIIPKLRAIKAKTERFLQGKLKTVTITKTTTGKYFASCLIDDGEDEPKKVEIKNSVGLDMGIKDFCVTSDGEVFESQKYLINSLKKLRVE